MKDLWRYLKNKFADPFHALVVAGIGLFILIFAANSLRNAFPNSVWIFIFDGFVGFFLFTFVAILGLFSIRQRYLPVFMIPITGFPSVAIGVLLFLGGSYFAFRWILLYTILLSAFFQ